MDWIKLNVTTYVRIIGNNDYEFVGIKALPRFSDSDDEPDIFTVVNTSINLSIIPDEILQSCVQEKGYQSLDKVKSELGDSANQFIAECFFDREVYRRNIVWYAPWYIKADEALEAAILEYKLPSA